MSYSEITKKTGVCRGTAHNWVKAYESAGQLENNSPGPKKGYQGQSDSESNQTCRKLHEGETEKGH